MGHVYRSDAADSNPVKPFSSLFGRSRPLSSVCAGRNTASEALSGEPFEAFTDAIRRDLGPGSTLEEVMVDRVALAAWRLLRISASEILSGEDGEDLPAITRETLRAECSLETALNMLDSTRRAPRPEWGKAVHHASKVDADLIVEPETDMHTDAADFLADVREEMPGLRDESDDEYAHEYESDLDLDLGGEAYYSNEWPTLPDDRDEDDSLDDEVEMGDATTSRWISRLTMDAKVSESSPVVRGTWVTAGQVVSMIVDGYTWSDVLRSHPELTEDDVRACLAYTVENDGYEGR